MPRQPARHVCMHRRLVQAVQCVTHPTSPPPPNRLHSKDISFPHCRCCYTPSQPQSTCGFTPVTEQPMMSPCRRTPRYHLGPIRVIWFQATSSNMYTAPNHVFGLNVFKAVVEQLLTPNPQWGRVPSTAATILPALSIIGTGSITCTGRDQVGNRLHDCAAHNPKAA